MSDLSKSLTTKAECLMDDTLKILNDLLVFYKGYLGFPCNVSFICLFVNS